MKQDKSIKFRLLYRILKSRVDENSLVTKKDILESTGWKASTFDTYYNKKLKDSFLVKVQNGYQVRNLDKYDEDSFLRLMSQMQSKSEKPLKRELKPSTEQFLDKAVESALLAVDVYNRPQTRFRTDGYIVLMIIAWTSLIHSILDENEENYYYKDVDGNFIIVDGEKKTWELSECLNHCDFIPHPVKENLFFMIGLRNKIEHRFIPSLDLAVCAECHSMLLNFENLLVEHYGIGYSLGSNLSIPLQLVNYNDEIKNTTMKKFYTENFDDIMQYICDFRDALSDDVYNDIRYSYKVFLVPKLKNNKNKNDVTMEFLNIKEIESGEYDDLMNAITLIKEKKIEIPVVNKGQYKPSQVCGIVSEKINKKFNLHHHTNAWKYFGVREKGMQPEGCNTQYCLYDELHQDYSYTSEWIDFLSEQLLDMATYDAIINYKERK